MSLYLGSNLISFTKPNNRTWWAVGQNPKFLYETTYQCSLSDTDYPSKTPSSTQQNVLFPATSYTNSASANVIFDRWGNGFNNGSALDLINYDYYVLADYLIDVAYVSGVDEATWGRTHTIKYTQTSIMPIYKNYVISGQNVLEGDVGATSLTVGYYGTYRLWYRTAKNALASVTTSYGFYLTPAVFSLSGVATDLSTVSYINFRTPTLYFRSNNTYHNLTAFIDSSNNNASWIDANDTIFKCRQRLYQTDKLSDSYYHTLINRQAKIYNSVNNSFPTEII